MGTVVKKKGGGDSKVGESHSENCDESNLPGMYDCYEGADRSIT